MPDHIVEYETIVLTVILSRRQYAAVFCCEVVVLNTSGNIYLRLATELQVLLASHHFLDCPNP